jgi:hypothetical protein
MCMINAPAKVSETEILVSPNQDNTRQITVYANNVQTQTLNNAMILPLPHPETVKLHDLSQYPEIFKECQTHFSSQSMGFGSSTNSYSNQSLSLEVHKVGAFDVSIVPTYRDFRRLNPDYFQLNPLLGGVLAKHYPVDFGFLVCKLRDGETSEKYHPIAYSHQIYKQNLMFVPTRHHYSGHEEILSHYDHAIYSINTKNLCGSASWNHEFRVNLQKIPNFQFPEIISFNQLKINQESLNTDLYFYLDRHIEEFGQHHGVDGCIFRTNHPEITFKNRGSVYTQPFYRGLPFVSRYQPKYIYDIDKYGISFAGTGTSFAVDGLRITVIDDIGTNLEHTIEFTCNPIVNNSYEPAVYQLHAQNQLPYKAMAFISP